MTLQPPKKGNFWRGGEEIVKITLSPPFALQVIITEVN